MIRIDADRYVVIFITHGDHTHRYAVEEQASCGLAAGHFMDDVDKKRRERTQTYTFEHDGVYIPSWLGVGTQLSNGARVTVVPVQTKEG